MHPRSFTPFRMTFLYPRNFRQEVHSKCFIFNKSEALEEMKVIFCFCIREGEKQIRHGEFQKHLDVSNKTPKRLNQNASAFFRDEICNYKFLPIHQIFKV